MGKLRCATVLVYCFQSSVFYLFFSVQNSKPGYEYGYFPAS